ncbi:MAG TPA: flagellar hook-associated protein FlgK [Steroidobacteraceae bacterium]
MADLLRTGLSGLLAFRRALDTTSHNIANVSTEGYSRQRVEISTRPATLFGNGWVGNGATVDTVRRVYDDFVAMQARTTASSYSRLDVFAGNAERINNMFADPETGLTATLQKFVNAFQGVANAPSSIPARQVLLSEANALVAKLEYYEDRLADMDREVNARLRSEVAEINALAQGIARLNEEIWAGTARGGGQPPNDLLDQRDKLLDQLSQKVSINVVMQDGGVMNVFIGNGQPLVLGTAASELTAVQDPFDASRLNVGLRTGGGIVDITRNISGGVLGGLLDFRREMLDPAHNALGRFSIALTDIVNSQHHAGIDLTGALGGDFFGTSAVEVLDRAGNAGTGSVAVTRSDVGALTTRDYVLELTANGWELRDADTGASVAMTGTGTAADPFVADGLEIVVDGAASVGDQFMIRPTRTAADGLSVLISDPSRIAAAAPIRTSVGTNNTGDATISAGEVIDSTNPDLRTPVTIQFLTPTTYSINGVGNYPYTSGADIEVNGWRVQISGTPNAGDEFTVSDNTGGTGDNRNALLLADALQRPVLNNGTTSLSAGVGEFVAGIGVATRQAQVSRDAQEAVHSENLAMLASISGVNLDEEAANLIKYQQAYQAAAQLIRVADTLFQTLLGATQR